MNDAEIPPGARLRRFARDAAVSTAVAAGLFALVEIALRVAAPQTSRTEVLSGEARAIKDPVLGYRYRPGARARHRTPEFDVEYAINGEGRRDFGASRPDSLAVRVLVLGDSFTFGDGNNSADVWTSVMESVFARTGIPVEIINAGVEGYDTHSEALYLEELVPKVRPHAVVLGFLANDVYTNTPEGTPPPQVDQGGVGFSLHTVEWVRRKLMQNDRAYTRMFLMTARKEYYTVPPTEHVRRQIEITRAWLSRMDAFCAARRIPFVVVSIPQQFAVIARARAMSLPGVDPEIIDREISDFPRERRERVYRDRFPWDDTPLWPEWIDVLPDLAKEYHEHRTDMYYRVDGHLTPAGNRVVAFKVAAEIASAVARRPPTAAAR